MDFSFSNLRRRLAVAGMVLAASAVAQAQTFTQPGQAIIFSAPDNGDAASNAPSLASPPPVAPGFADTIHAPGFNFEPPSKTSAPPPAPAAARVSPGEADRRKNWALMTPAEILGVATPENILKIPERDAAGRRMDPTAVERFYERQNQVQTNGVPSLRGNFPGGEYGRLDADIFKPSD